MFFFSAVRSTCLAKHKIAEVDIVMSVKFNQKTWCRESGIDKAPTLEKKNSPWNFVFLKCWRNVGALDRVDLMLLCLRNPEKCRKENDFPRGRWLSTNTLPLTASDVSINLSFGSLYADTDIWVAENIWRVSWDSPDSSCQYRLKSSR